MLVEQPAPRRTSCPTASTTCRPSRPTRSVDSSHIRCASAHLARPPPPASLVAASCALPHLTRAADVPLTERCASDGPRAGARWPGRRRCRARAPRPLSPPPAVVSDVAVAAADALCGRCGVHLGRSRGPPCVDPLRADSRDPLGWLRKGAGDARVAGDGRRRRVVPSIRARGVCRSMRRARVRSARRAMLARSRVESVGRVPCDQVASCGAEPSIGPFGTHAPVARQVASRPVPQRDRRYGHIPALYSTLRSMPMCGVRSLRGLPYRGAVARAARGGIV